ncbi:ribonuclease H-like domain-containing protein [Mycena rebaudengoi]|nr:ribonuclease H-like domain-containing protein [Mycena rebaudengoi]
MAPTVLDAHMAFNLPHPLPANRLAITSSSSHDVHRMWDPPRQEEFAEDLCKLFIACNVAWNSAANPELLLFFSKYIPEAKIPDRRVLSGRVLDTLVVQVEADIKSKVSGKLGTGQCDGWKTGAKASIITTSVTVEGKIYTNAAHDVSPDKKSAENLLQIVLGDIEYCEKEFGIIFIGYCTDNGGDARGMRPRLQRIRPKFTVPPCWGHQVNIMVGEVLELELPCMGSMDDGLEIAKWFTNHSRALGMLKDQQKTTERFKRTNRALTLIFPVISRWTVHFLCTRRFLVLSPPMRALYYQDYEALIQCAGAKADAKAKARAVLEPIEDPQFWKNIAEVKLILEPLAIAAKCMQAPDAGLDQVLLMLGNLYRIYGDPEVDSRVRNCIRNSLEKRWLAMEREIFILALFLNPYIRDSDLDFHAAFFDYSNDRADFSSSYMQLSAMKELHERENKRVNVVTVWQQLDTGQVNGRNGVVKLAIWVLSIVANSAGSERGFSKFGIFLIKLRNQLSIQKVRKMNTIDMELKRKHEELGMTTDRIKRKFVHFAEQHGGVQPGTIGYDDADSFAHLSTQLIRNSTDERNFPVDDDEEEYSPTPSPHSPANFTLKNLFEYPETSEDSVNTLGFYWHGGIKDLQEELELYDLLMEDLDL